MCSIFFLLLHAVHYTTTSHDYFVYAVAFFIVMNDKIIKRQAITIYRSCLLHDVFVDYD